MDIVSVVVCVEYDDLLAITLPRNRHHFSHTLVITTHADYRTQRLCGSIIGESGSSDIATFATEAFFDKGAEFNKGAAIEACFSALGSPWPDYWRGWVCHWDADIVLPETLSGIDDIRPGCLYQPLRRRHCADPRDFRDGLDWQQCPPMNEREDIGLIGGWFQLFHGSDPVLKRRPWYPTSWTHAGNSDTFFNYKWSRSRQRRLPFEVLHLGEPRRNWYGRTTPRLDGEAIPEAPQRAQKMAAMDAQRRARRSFNHERIRERPSE